MLVAFVLRFWCIWELEYSYDELSAVLRAAQPTWKEHIQNGVIPDGHPALVQTIIWLLGDHVTLLKCLAASAGTAAVYFVYRAGKAAFNSAAGLCAAALMATLYMPVFWSQQIRPYAFGMCFTTALLWNFSQIVFENKSRFLNYLCFGLLLSLCAYTHYFAALFASIVYLSLVVIQFKKQYKFTLLSGLMALLIFLPHLGITWAQFTTGQLSWLGRPTYTFFQEHLFEIFSKSILFGGLVLIFVITGIIVILRNKYSIPYSKISLFLGLFLLPMLIGFVYSYIKSPVLQHSVLLFSLPALLLVIGYFCSNLPINIFQIQMGLILICGTSILILERKHYTIGYQETWSSAIKKVISNPCEGRIYADAPEDVWQYYWNKINQTQKVKHAYFLLPISTSSLKEKFAGISENADFKLALGSGSDPGMIPVFEDMFDLSDRTSFIGSEVICFKASVNKKVRYTERANFIDSPLQFEFKKILGSNEQKNIVIVIRFKPNDSLANGEIQTAIMNGSSLVDWRSEHFNPATRIPNGWYYLCIKLADIPKWNIHNTLVIKVLHEEIPIEGILEIRTSQGNPYLYGVP